MQSHSFTPREFQFVVLNLEHRAVYWLRWLCLSEPFALSLLGGFLMKRHCCCCPVVTGEELVADAKQPPGPSWISQPKYPHPHFSIKNSIDTLLLCELASFPFLSSRQLKDPFGFLLTKTCLAFGLWWMDVRCVSMYLTNIWKLAWNVVEGSFLCVRVVYTFDPWSADIKGVDKCSWMWLRQKATCLRRSWDDGELPWWSVSED